MCKAPINEERRRVLMMDKARRREGAQEAVCLKKSFLIFSQVDSHFVISVN